MEFAAKLPPDYKMHGLNEKYILKRMMDKRLPDSVLKRPKQAYRAPMAGSFLSSPAKEYVTELLSERDLNLTGMFSPNSVNKLLEKVSGGQPATEMENMALSGIISSQLIYHQYILKDNFRPALPKLDNCRVIHEQNPVYSR
jgi:asparagine synthase (glutamine-hydrolysing)